MGTKNTCLQHRTDKDGFTKVRPTTYQELPGISCLANLEMIISFLGVVQLWLGYPSLLPVVYPCRTLHFSLSLSHPGSDAHTRQEMDHRSDPFGTESPHMQLD
jgi:hypothetical protein